MTESPTGTSWLPAGYEPGLVSLVIATFNRAALLRETLESVFRQDYRPLEVIVVDDGSTDSTLSILESLQRPEGIELKVIRAGHAGAAAARNRGAAASRGEFVMFLDSDDLLHEGALTALTAGIGEADLVHGLWRDWYSSEVPPRYGRTYCREHGPDLLVELLRNQWLLPSAVLHRRSMLGRVGGWDETFGVEDDFEFMARLALKRGKAAAVNRLVADYRRHGVDQLHRTGIAGMSQATERVLRRVEAALDAEGWTEPHRDAMAWRWFWEARKAWAEAGDAKRFDLLMREAFRVQPGFKPPKRWYRWIAGLFGYRNAERFAAMARKLLRRRRPRTA